MWKSVALKRRTMWFDSTDSGQQVGGVAVARQTPNLLAKVRVLAFLPILVR
jgi:hypothetical protein